MRVSLPPPAALACFDTSAAGSCCSRTLSEDFGCRLLVTPSPGIEPALPSTPEQTGDTLFSCVCHAASCVHTRWELWQQTLCNLLPGTESALPSTPERTGDILVVAHITRQHVHCMSKDQVTHCESLWHLGQNLPCHLLLSKQVTSWQLCMSLGNMPSTGNVSACAVAAFCRRQW